MVFGKDNQFMINQISNVQFITAQQKILQKIRVLTFMKNNLEI